ncbi:DEAD/DEAH box helicase [Desulfosoma caldarium]|uniref:DEAD/DEAH box helicase domain-containing protein n=1 Tax=Desulfosoma caldarium TaxID=610254 RepID=A0A3N1UTT6_9BACT|nr:DEAD/DEAH box helicase [Desulfosoma caldarium]ROQ93563.1 DEAD/DEAH box helicase domain-containing protein [Desulfosoma caldarium]
MKKFLHRLLTQEWKSARVAHHAVLEAQDPQYGAPHAPLPKPLSQALHALGIRRLYKHQAAALDFLRSGHHVVVATPTASGKSLIYNMAVTEALLQNPHAHALYLFPIKALSRDQWEALNTFFEAVPSATPFTAAVYDGDTTSHQRAVIRRKPPHVLVSNPDMLHYALLPYHAKWESFFRGLRYVVVDELHTYRGIFGSHVAQILRRLQRITDLYGARPRYVFLSATIGNPGELAQKLIDQPVKTVTHSGSPQARRHFVFMESEGPLASLAARITQDAVRLGLKTIVFTQSRRMTELVHMSLLRAAPHLAHKVSSYRAGFLPSERRSIEQGLAEGRIAAVISTSALEMGIDVGGLDVCLLVGYPGTIMTTWQRGGRVGRSGGESAVIMLPQPDALDQYIVRHPETFLNGSCENAVTDPDNPAIVAEHLPCAAAEIPVRAEEAEAWAPSRQQALLSATNRGTLVQSEDGQKWFAVAPYPHRGVDIRSVGPSFTILAPDGQNKTRWIPIGTTDGVRAFKECHPGAVYLHRGRAFVVQSLDLVKRIARAVPQDAEYYTWVKSEKETEILEILASKPCTAFIARLGRLRVREHITGYEKKRLFTQELLDFTPLDLPEQVFETVGFWVEIEEAIVERIRRANLHYMGGIHAMEHAAISMFPLFALCDRNDIGGISIPLHPQLGKSAVFIYDGYPEGIGLAARGYDIVEALLERTLELIESCPCDEGCPGCIHSPKCGAGNTPLDKEAAMEVLRYLLGRKPLGAEETKGGLQQEEAQGFTRPEASAAKPEPAIGFLDLETQKLAQDVGGWDNKHLMRVSVAVLYDHRRKTIEVYREHEVSTLIDRLHALDLVVGFNIKNFDFQVLQAYTPKPLQHLPAFDMLEAVRQQLGFRLSLDHLSEKTLGRKKTADGIQAVQWFRENRWDLLIDYCQEDVLLTRDLFFHAIEKGYLIYEDRSGKRLRVPTPWNLEKILEEYGQKEDKKRTILRRHRPAGA